MIKKERKIMKGDNPLDTFSGGSASAAPDKSKMWPEESHHDARLHELLVALGYKVGGVRETEVREKEACMWSVTIRILYI
ncbi:hypothetical protein LguiA_019900 [Lonicera macranthoides]